MYQLEMSNQATPGDYMLKTGACQNITGDRGTPGQGCHSGSPTICRQLYITDIPSEKERGRTKDGHKPERPQQLCENGAPQDGRAPYFARCNRARSIV